MLSDTSGLAEGVLGRVSCRTSRQAWDEMWETVNRPRVAHDGGSIPASRPAQTFSAVIPDTLEDVAKAESSGVYRKRPG